MVALDDFLWHRDEGKLRGELKGDGTLPTLMEVQKDVKFEIVMQIKLSALYNLSLK